MNHYISHSHMIEKQTKRKYMLFKSAVRTLYTRTITRFSITDDLLGIIDAIKSFIKNDDSLHEELMNYFSIVKKNVNSLFNLFNRQIKQQQEKNDALLVESERYGKATI